MQSSIACSTGEVTVPDSEPRQSLLFRLKTCLDLLATGFVIVAASAVLWRVFQSDRSGGPVAATGTAAVAVKPAEALPSEPLSLEGAALKGNPAARVAIVEFSDFQCPYCAKFAHSTLPDLAKRYIDSGQVLFAFRHFPLEKIHPSAKRAAEAAECARRQDMFWPIHDRLFASQKQLSAINFSSFGKTLGLNALEFETCMNGDVADSIKSDHIIARALGVSGTPTFFVGLVQPDGRVKSVRRLSGAQSFAGFAKILDSALSQALAIPPKPTQ